MEFLLIYTLIELRRYRGEVAATQVPAPFLLLLF
jgi:hypothetical protein